jgi:peptidylprolyl isomerase
MSRRTHRLLLPVAVLGLLAGLTACGSDSSKQPTQAADSSAAPSDAATSTSPEDLKALDAITVSGDFGKEPKITWAKELTVTSLASSVLIEGDGADIKTGDNLLAQVWIGNGVSKQQAYSTFGDRPQLLTMSQTMLPALVNGLVGKKIGSRVLIAAPPKDAYGDQGNAQLGIGNADTVVFVIDVLDTLATGPDGGPRKPAAWAPSITETDGKPSGLDFSAAPKPSGRLLRTTVVAGTGAPVKKGEHIYVDYLGQVYGADAPFDQSYSRGTPFDFDLGGGNVVKGWDQGLVGVKVGSRVILQIPPRLGYGKDGQPSVGIGPTDTMYFVVDVLAAS